MTLILFGPFAQLVKPKRLTFLLVTFPAPTRGAAVFQLRARGASGAQEHAGLQTERQFFETQLEILISVDRKQFQ